MKKVILFTSILMVSVVLLLLQSVNMQTVKVLIDGAPSGCLNLPCILEVTTDGWLIATSGVVSLERTDGTLDSEKYFTENKKRESRKLTRKSRQEIESFIDKIKLNCDPEDLSAMYQDGALIVCAEIDGVRYYSLYHDYNRRETNEAVRELAQKMVQLSPIDVEKTAGTVKTRGR